MRKVSLSLALIMTASYLYSQKAAMKIAERYFQKFEYAAAVKAYEKVLLADSGNLMAIEKMALCYTKLNNHQKSEIWLARACKQSNVAPTYFRMYAEALASNGKYQESAVWYSKYNEAASDQSTRSHSELHTLINQFYKDSAFYRISFWQGNSGSADFSPAFYKEGIVFCSARENKTAKKYGWDGSHFIDLYSVDNFGSQPTSLGAPVNSPLHEGPATFSENFDTLYFTRNNYVNSKKAASAEGVVKLKVYFAMLKDGAWTKEKEMPMNNNEYSVGHPTLHHNKLYFASDMPGGSGGTDIYASTFQNGAWSAPENLGEQINTSGNEMFPFVSDDNVLYFASTGHPGLGGLDIFYSKYSGGKYRQPQNIGYPINSSKDDFGLIIKDQKGYFSSNRGDNQQDDNIYSVIVDFTKPMHIQINDIHGKNLEDFQISVSSDSSLVRNVHSRYTENFDCKKNYVLAISKNGYKSKSLNITSQQLAGFPHNHTLLVTLEKKVKNINITLLSDKRTTLAQGSVELRNMSTGESKTFVTTETGMMNFSFIEGQDYIITGAHPNFKSKSIELKDISQLREDTVLTLTLQSPEALFEKNEIGQIIELDIRYDVNKSSIRKDAALELDKLVEFLKKNPNVRVELGSHTDSRGGDEANLVLSQKRAESAVRYIVAKGVSSKRLIPVGYGEDELKVANAETEDQHQLNRRTTVKIVKI
jgi:outer membrane protein OmpA-like peptidoglycan-associated protein